MPKEIFHDPLLSSGNAERTINTGVFWSLRRCGGDLFSAEVSAGARGGRGAGGGGPDTAAAAGSASNS